VGGSKTTGFFYKRQDFRYPHEEVLMKGIVLTLVAVAAVVGVFAGIGPAN
jgi:hypothetical protein